MVIHADCCQFGSILSNKLTHTAYVSKKAVDLIELRSWWRVHMLLGLRSRTH